MTRQPARICANCGVGVAAQSSFRRSYPFETATGKHFVVVAHLCHGCRARFKNEQEADGFLAAALPAGLLTGR